MVEKNPLKEDNFTEAITVERVDCHVRDIFGSYPSYKKPEEIPNTRKTVSMTTLLRMQPRSPVK